MNFAAWQGNHDVMQILLYYGAVPDHACKQGATALGISAQEGHEECVSILLQYSANPMKADHCGRTPFKLAAKSNRTGVLKVLENFVKSKLIFFYAKKFKFPAILKFKFLKCVTKFSIFKIKKKTGNLNFLPDYNF